MKTHKKAFITVVIVGLGIIFFGWFASVNAERANTSKEYEVIVGEAKSDTQRIIEAYERLSDQYLSLVQSQFTLIATNNRDMTARLERMERKIDELSAKIDAMQKNALPPKPAVAPIAPVQPMPQVAPPAQNTPVAK